MTEMPKFEGREIVPRVKPKNICAEFLGGKFGKAVDEQVQKRYGDIPAISKISYNDAVGEVDGSNMFYVTAVNEVVNSEGLRTMTYDDYRQIKNSDSLNLSGKYEDIAAVVRGSDDYYAKKFIGNKEFDFPITVNLADCVLSKDNKSEHGIVLTPKDEAQIISGDVADYKGSVAFSRLYLSRLLYLYSDWYYLSDSNSDGRVVIVKDL
jgi:hypothetical protein